MKFSFTETKCTELGLTLRHGNNDNVTFFFDEVEKAARYELLLFRTDLINEYCGFIYRTSNIRKDEYEFDCGYPRYSSGNKEIDVYFDEKMNSIAFHNNKLMSQSIRVEYENVNIKKKNGNYHPENISNKSFRGVNAVDFSEVKYITTLESERNGLYFFINFLPVGKYIAILQAEDRTGENIECSYPYYFGIEKQTNDELMKAIGAVGRAAAGHSVTI